MGVAGFGLRGVNYGVGLEKRIITLGKKSREKRERRAIKMSDETAKAVEEQLERFRAKFGTNFLKLFGRSSGNFRLSLI